VRRARPSLLLAALLLAGALPGLADEPSPERGTVRPALSDVLRTPRPAGGEYFGLYLVDKKVGW